MAPPKFKDLLKAPSDLLSDDFTSKKSIKFKLPTGGITFNAENEFKLSKRRGRVDPGEDHVQVRAQAVEGLGRQARVQGRHGEARALVPLRRRQGQGQGRHVKGKDLGGSVEFDTCVGGASVLAALNLNKFKLDLSAVTGMKGLNVGAKVQADKSHRGARARAGPAPSSLPPLPRAALVVSLARARGPP